MNTSRLLLTGSCGKARSIEVTKFRAVMQFVTLIAAIIQKVVRVKWQLSMQVAAEQRACNN